ncbi:MAG: efflux RND transporter periplasmic adaptor subunit [Chloroflexi bacterium]|nr:efflux RND transporter periplasmic adaptor subunit [Chloroflexota bacterium]
MSFRKGWPLPACLLASACLAFSQASEQLAPHAGAAIHSTAEMAGVVEVTYPAYRQRTSVLGTTGKIQYDEERLARVCAPLTGRVIEVRARLGDAVRAGQPLAVIDSPDLGTATSEYVKADADVARTSAQLEVKRDVYRVGGVAKRELRDAENEFRKAVAERKRARARLSMLGVPEARLRGVTADSLDSTLVVTAPRNGVVVERNAVAGQVSVYGQSDTPSSLFVIAELSSVWAVVDVYEPDIPRIAVGQVVSVTLPSRPEKPYAGRVTNVAASVDPVTRTVKVRAQVPNLVGVLKNEMFVNASIATGDERVLTVPQAAIHREEGATFVLLETSPGAYRRQSVKLGEETEETVEVLEGLGPSDRVASTGSILLKSSAH